MSHRRTHVTVPPPDVAAVARAYECGHCDAHVLPPVWQDAAWHLSVAHDATCPVLLGVVDSGAQLDAAIRTAGL
jgi:hypothetical protein